MLNIGSNRELFVDDFLIDTEKTTAEFRIHAPVRKGVVMVQDAPWEGNGCGYYNFFYDNGVWRMYYLGYDMYKVFAKTDTIRVCYAESRDGIHWEKPELGLFEYNGSKQNNILLDHTVHKSIDNFMVFRDDNPACEPEKKYKAVCSMQDNGGVVLVCFFSEDGIHFTKGDIVTDKGHFDTLNVAFWDAIAKKYRCYFRGFHPRTENGEKPVINPNEPVRWDENDVRDIRYIESVDFVHWSKPKLVDFGDSEDIPLYTNGVQPYYRAPQILVGFPHRYIRRPGWNGNFEELCGKEARQARMKMNPRYGLAITDCVFMASRDGWHFNRIDEAFLRPEPEEPCGWVYGSCSPARGMIETPGDIEGQEPEISMYIRENHWADKPTDFVRYTIRRDGFVSLHAGAKEKRIVTKPFIFDGSEMRINFATSARGYLYITLTAEDGTVLESCETFGNSTDRRVHFDGDVAALAGKAVTMTVRMLDADLYAIRFC